MSLQSDSLFLLGCSHQTAPLDVREKLAIADDSMKKFYGTIREICEVDECLILNTCNRVEFYGISQNPVVQNKLETTFCSLQNFDPRNFTKYRFWKNGINVIQHLFEVSAGIDSQMIGETEILGQVKDSYSYAVSNTSVGPVLHRVFQKGFQAAKWVRSNTKIGEGQISIGNVAADLAKRIYGDLKNCRILVVGIGEAGEKTVKALKSKGASSISITSRTISKAEALAREVVGQTVPIENLSQLLSHFDIVICSTSSTEYILSYETIQEIMKDRQSQPLFLIDLAVPRDIDIRTSTLSNVFLYNLDDLAQIANENLLSRKAEIERCRTILNSKANTVWHNISSD